MAMTCRVVVAPSRSSGGEAAGSSSGEQAVRKQVRGPGLGEQRVEPQHKGILVPEEVEVSNEHCWVDAHGYTQDLVVVP